MADINISFCRELLKKAHELVKLNFPDINLKSCSWVWTDSRRNHWEFHGPDGFYWHGRANNSYHARYQSWMAWLRSMNALDEMEE